MMTQTDIDAFQERMLHIASGLELLRSMDGDEPGYCYLKNSLCADIERHLDDCERLMPRIPRKARKNGAAQPRGRQ